MEYIQSIYLKSDLKVTFSYAKIQLGGCMEIIGYKKLKTNLYEITIKDGLNKEKIELYDDIILKYDLLIDKTLTKTKLNTIIKENEITKSYFEALKYISRKMRTEKEIKEFLKKKEYSEYSIQKSIDRLKREGYLNQEIYISSYINDALQLSNDGPIKIKNSLMKLGIKESLIDESLGKIKRDIFINRMIKIIEKKKKLNKDSKIIFKTKLKSQLFLLGYSEEMINSLIDEMEVDESANFDREANKCWEALARKYKDRELSLKFKNKMYTKGFQLDMINDFLDNKTSQ